MTSSGIRDSKLWASIHIAVILACAVQVVCPPARHFMPLMIPFAFVLLPFYFYLHIRSLKEDRTANLSLGELHAQAKAGRRFPRSSLATASAIALLLMTVYAAAGLG